MRGTAQVIAALCLIAGCDSVEIHPVPDEPFACEDDRWEAAKVDPRRFIAHAGGQIDGRMYTNSLEALELAYDRGLKLFELDLIRTRDGHLVAAHDWGWWQDATGSALEEPTLRQFLELPLFGAYRTLDLPALDRWFAEHADAWLVTDKVDDFRALLDGFSHDDRMIVEVFGVDEFRRAANEGIRYPMLSLGASIRQDGKQAIIALLEETPVKFAAVATKDMNRTAAVLELMRDNGACVYVFTSSDPAFLEQQFESRVFGAYTDGWNVNEGTCTAAACETY